MFFVYFLGLGLYIGGIVIFGDDGFGKKGCLIIGSRYGVIWVGNFEILEFKVIGIWFRKGVMEFEGIYLFVLV